MTKDFTVAPHAGAWIEIQIVWAIDELGLSSLPMRERGLKSLLDEAVEKYIKVAPHAGAWIEITQLYQTQRE